MMRRRKSSTPCRQIAFSLGASFLFAFGLAANAHAADYLDLPVVKPVISCEQLPKADVSQAAGAAVTIKSAAVTDTPKGSYCKVTGVIEPNIGFEVDLPIEHWTQRYAQQAAGGQRIANAGANLPALNGELVVAGNNRGEVLTNHQLIAEYTGELAGGAKGGRITNQQRIDWAYRGNHETALVGKALTEKFYGQKPRFSYFTGCSEGGRESLDEAQRYPADFDGISAAAPVALDNLHNPIYHLGELQANQRADGSAVLTPARASILHDAVMMHCAARSGVIDGVLQNPFACKFDPAWALCPKGATDKSKCLTPEEVAVVVKLYAGPADAAGHRFEIGGFPMGTEAMWFGPGTPGGPSDDEMIAGPSVRRVLFQPEDDEDTDTINKKFAITEEWFNKLLTAAPLWNSTNTNLRPFEQHGSKLILWHGAADLIVQPAISLAYYQGVQKVLGAKQTDTFMRYFLLPGVGHCGGGQTPTQLDTLTPLMAWTEMHQAPAKLIAGRTAGGQAAGGRGGRGGRGPNYPYSVPDQPALFTRPIYPYPYIARYTGNGDEKDAANYEPVKSSAPIPLAFDTQAMQLIGPDNQLFYHVENGKLVGEKAK